jgi:hypothetical protein
MIAEALEGYTDQCQKQVQKSMEEGGNRFCKSIKMTAEAVIVDWWHH